MSEKLPIYVTAPSSPPPVPKSRKRAFVAGALIGAAALWSVARVAAPFVAHHVQPTAPATVVDDDLQTWITREAALSHHKIFQHLGPTAGASEGLVIAAPSTNHPDYFYTWTRDSAIVTGTILDRLVAGEVGLEATLRLYTYSQSEIQKTCNPSGCPTDGGLGEPKFNADGSPYRGSWGRPQRDGPALRAITLIRFANYLLDRAQPADLKFVHKFMYSADTSSGNSVIKNDLEYTSHTCLQESFDLWEEAKDLHFFTLLACRKALTLGSDLAHRLGDQGAANYYTSQAAALKSYLLNPSNFGSIDGSYRAYLSRPYGRRGVDSSVLIAILAAGDPGDQNFGPSAPAVLSSIKVYVDAFRGMYAIGNKTSQREGIEPVPTGRYPEDKWNGYETTDGTVGNPWYICTVTVSHLLDLAVMEFISAGKIKITSVSLPFFRQFAPDVQIGTFSKGSETYATLLNGMRNWSDGFYKIIRQFQGPGGVLYEQFGRTTGLPQGAPNLTWSFAAFANAARARHSLAEFMN